MAGRGRFEVRGSVREHEPRTELTHDFRTFDAAGRSLG